MQVKTQQKTLIQPNSYGRVIDHSAETHINKSLHQRILSSVDAVHFDIQLANQKILRACWRIESNTRVKKT